MQKANSYSQSAKYGVFWSIVSRFGTLLITFLSNLVLVRLLTPADFGIIGLLMVFVAVANTLLDGGLGVALIQKKTPTEEDYSTVFTFNITISVILYLVLFFSAPLISRFYDIELLSSVLRVQGIVLLINAGRIIQYNLLIKHLRFKKLAIIDISSATIGALCGIWMAQRGFGVWSLVFNNLIYSAVFTIVINISKTWRPQFQFHYSQFKKLFSFGGMMMLSNIFDILYKNIQNVVIGKLFNPSTLGYYTQAKKMEEVPVQGISSAVNSVFFPVFSQLQNDKQKLAVALSRSINVISYIVCPIMILVIVIAEPLIEIVYTSKWSSSVPLFQLLCLAGMVLPINMLNLNVIKSLGKGKLYFKLQILQLVLGFVAMLVGSQWGVVGLIYGYIFTSYAFMFLLFGVNRSLLCTGVFLQISHILRNFALAVVSGGVVVYIGMITNLSNMWSVVVMSILYVCTYLTLSFIFKISGLKECVKIVFNRK